MLDSEVHPDNATGPESANEGLDVVPDQQGMRDDGLLGQPGGDVAPSNTEQFASENTTMAGYLHTLLGSFPPGAAREAMLREFPELGDSFSTGQAFAIASANPEVLHGTLGGLLERAVAATGGSEFAEFYLSYPGLTSNENLHAVRPVPSEWQKAGNEANASTPGIDAAIRARIGLKIMQDIANGDASWDDVVFGYLDEKQIESDKREVALLHGAFMGAPLMPAGHDHAKKLATIPDARFGTMWRSFAKNAVRVGRMTATWAERAEGISLPAADPPPPDRESVVMDPANAVRLNALFSDERLRPYVQTMISVLGAAAEALDSGEGRSLIKQYKQNLNTRSVNGQDPSVARGQIFDLVSSSIDERAFILDESGRGPALPDGLEDTLMAILKGGGGPR